MQTPLALTVLWACLQAPSTRVPTPTPVVVTDANVDAVYERGTAAISPHMQLLDRDPTLDDRGREAVRAGIRDLDAVTTYNPENWPAFWIKGKGYQVLGDHASANAEFKASFALQPENPDVAREYAASCLELGLGAEAVRVAEHSVELAPADAGLRANLALALLIAGRNAEAATTLDEALRMAPDDPISRSLQRILDEVVSGRRPQPTRMSDLTGAPATAPPTP